VTNPAVPSVRKGPRGEGQSPSVRRIPSMCLLIICLPRLDGSCNPVTGDRLTFVMADSGYLTSQGISDNAASFRGGSFRARTSKLVDRLQNADWEWISG